MSQNSDPIPESQEKLLSVEEKQEASNPQQDQEESKPHEQETPEPQEQETPEPQEQETPEPQEQETPESQEQETPEPPEQETPEPQEQETSKPQEQETPEPQEQETPEPREQKASKLQEQETSKPQEQKKSKPRNQEASGPQEQETSELQEKEECKPQEQEASQPQEQQVLPTYFSKFITFWKSFVPSKSSHPPQTQKGHQSVKETEGTLNPIELEVPPTIVSLASLRTITDQFSDSLSEQARTLTEEDRDQRIRLLDIADRMREISTELRSLNDNNVLSSLSQIPVPMHLRTIFANPGDTDVFNGVIGEMTQLDFLRFCLDYIQYLVDILELWFLENKAARK